MPETNGDILEHIEHFLEAYREDDDEEFIANPIAYHWLTVGNLRAAAAELKRLRADNAALLDGNRRLQAMNEGLRRMAIEAREAANSWQQATIDLYSGRVKSHPVNCGCGPQAGNTGDPS